MADPLTNGEVRICGLTGVNVHDYIETRERERTEALNREKPLSAADEDRMFAMMGVTREAVERYSGNLALNATQTGPGTDPEKEARIREAEQSVMKLMSISESQFRLMQKQSEAAQLTSEEIEVCRKMGIIPADYLAEKMKSAGLKEHPSGHMTVK